MHKMIRDVIVLIAFFVTLIVLVYLLTEKMDGQREAVRIESVPRPPTGSQSSYTEEGWNPQVTREVIDGLP